MHNIGGSDIDTDVLKYSTTVSLRPSEFIIEEPFNGITEIEWLRPFTPESSTRERTQSRTPIRRIQYEIGHWREGSQSDTSKYNSKRALEYEDDKGIINTLYQRLEKGAIWLDGFPRIVNPLARETIFVRISGKPSRRLVWQELWTSWTKEAISS